MSKEIKFHASTQGELQGALTWASRTGAKGLEAGPIELVLRRPSKNRIQEEKYHAMINDIHRQCFRGSTSRGVKAVLVNQFALEMEEQETPLAHPGEKVWDWKTQEAVYVRPSTTDFRKHEAAQFIEFLYATGTELGVQWSKKALDVYEEYREVANA